MSLFDATDLEPAGPSGPLVRVRMTVAYQGGGFKGFAANPGMRTVAGSLQEALQKVLRQPVRITCAGRTDSGVHGWGQVVSFDVSVAEGEPDLAAVQRSLNRMLAPAVAVRDVGVAPGAFDARRSALSRSYRYTVLNRPVPDPFLAQTAWHVDEPLDLRSMQLACDPLIGEHDFSALCRRPPDADASQPLTRRLMDARWLDLGEGVLRFDVTASAFCHQMVRAIVGLHVAIGQGRKRAGDVAWILRSRDRANAGGLAPPHGLCLWEVRYPPDEVLERGTPAEDPESVDDSGPISPR